MPHHNHDMLFDYQAKLMTLDALVAECGRLRADGVTVVAAGGCFDILHVGHVRTLQTARRLGDRLVVLLNSDLSVRRIKGPDRPINHQDARAEMLGGLACVDYVHIFDDASLGAILARVQPAIFCKGADYAPPHGKPLPADEIAAIAAYGGRIEYLPLIPDNSTSSLVQRIREHA